MSDRTVAELDAEILKTAERIGARRLAMEADEHALRQLQRERNAKLEKRPA